MIGTAATHERDRQSALTDDPERATAVDAQAPPSLRVVAAIVETTGRDPTTMPPLYTVVDTDALDSLFEGASEVRIEFDYEGHDVEVRGDGSVAVDDTVFEVR